MSKIALTDIPNNENNENNNNTNSGKKSSTGQPLFPNETPFSGIKWKIGGNGSTDTEQIPDNNNSGSRRLEGMMSQVPVSGGGVSGGGGVGRVGGGGSDGGIGSETEPDKLTGTPQNLNLLQGSIYSHGATDVTKNPIRPFKTNSEVGDNLPVSYKEGLSNDVVTTSSTGTTSAGKSTKLLDLEKQLSELTTKYTTQYRLYTDDLLTRSQFIQTNSKYTNKLVRDISFSGTDVSAAYYYINSFGYTHRYKDLSAVTLNDSSCPTITRDAALADDKFNPFKVKDVTTTFIDISGANSTGFSRFSDYASYDMVATPCIVTKNVKTIIANGNAEYAWVDVQGRKHIYEKGVWPDKRHSSCLTAVVGEPIDLSLDRYNAIPTATDAPMKEETECFKTSVSPSINTRLSDLKKEIDDVVAAIKKENQNILNNAANTTIIQRESTFAEKWANLDEDILAQLKTWLGGYYYPAIYAFWALIVLISVLIIFKFAFYFVSPNRYNNGNSGVDIVNGETAAGGVSLLGIVIVALIVIFIVVYYFKTKYNINLNVQRASDTPYTVI